VAGDEQIARAAGFDHVLGKAEDYRRLLGLVAQI
jgi:hypothetical protein